MYVRVVTLCCISDEVLIVKNFSGKPVKRPTGRNWAAEDTLKRADEATIKMKEFLKRVEPADKLKDYLE